jgi:hypothetical protein
MAMLNNQMVAVRNRGCTMSYRSMNLEQGYVWLWIPMDEIEKWVNIKHSENLWDASQDPNIS